MSILKNFAIFALTISLASCTLNKIDNVHGVPNLKNKSKLLKINKSNKNDIVKLLGPAPIKSEKEKKWTYFEVRETKTKFGKKDIYVNDYIEITFDKYGLISNFDFYDLNSMQKLKFSEDTTRSLGVKDTFSKNLLSSTRKRLENARKRFED